MLLFQLTCAAPNPTPSLGTRKGWTCFPMTGIEEEVEVEEDKQVETNLLLLLHVDDLDTIRLESIVV